MMPEVFFYGKKQDRKTFYLHLHDHDRIIIRDVYSET